MPKLKTLVAEYIRCRYWILREGELPLHQQDALPRLLAAEEAMFKAVSGEGELFDAMKALGFAMAKCDGGTLGRDKKYTPQPKPTLKKKNPKKGKKTPKRVKLGGGFFSD